MEAGSPGFEPESEAPEASVISRLHYEPIRWDVFPCPVKSEVMH